MKLSLIPIRMVSPPSVDRVRSTNNYHKIVPKRSGSGKESCRLKDSFQIIFKTSGS